MCKNHEENKLVYNWNDLFLLLISFINFALYTTVYDNSILNC